jgi:hypothetical protein
MNPTPTPEQAAELLAQAETNERRSRTDDAWPLVLLLFALSTAFSVALVAVGVIDGDSELVVFFAALAWLVPAMIVYVVKALSWSRRMLGLLFTWLGVILVASFAGLFADTVLSAGWVPFAAAGLLWVAAPVFAFLTLRR